MSSSTTVSTELELQLVVPDGPPVPVRADLRYDIRDPWAVRVAFPTGGEDDTAVVWMFARRLLSDGLGRACGDGDVRVWPASGGPSSVINLSMSSPTGSALFEIDRDQLVGFLQRTYVAVPTGAESEVVDLDAELALLLDR